MDTNTPEYPIAVEDHGDPVLAILLPHIAAWVGYAPGDYQPGYKFEWPIDKNGSGEFDVAYRAVSEALSRSLPHPADMTDAELRAAWLRTDGEVGDPVADALAAEMERREIDV